MASTRPLYLRANSRAPRPPSSPPSVATKRSVWAGTATVVPGGALPVIAPAYERASSIKAATPDALSFAPGPVPWSSRCATTASAWGERPGIVRTRFTSFVLPRPGMFASNGSSRTRSPGEICSVNHSRAPRAPSEPAVRSG